MSGRHTFFVFSLLAASSVYSATLKPESMEAWQEYLSSATAKAQQRTLPSGKFLWLDESAIRKAKVQQGQILVSEHNYAGSSKKAPSALIHHWIGAAFIPGVKAEDIIAIARDYDRYSEYYRPAVVQSRTISKSPEMDRFSLQMVNEAIVLKTAVETECQSILTKAGDKRWQSITTSTRVQEIENYRRPNERKLPAGEGSGYVWKAASITRYEERDNGVYVELEVLALSRDIPVSLRFIVDPIVRRLSRSTLAESLRQTGKAATSLVAQNSSKGLASGQN